MQQRISTQSGYTHPLLRNMPRMAGMATSNSILGSMVSVPVSVFKERDFTNWFVDATRWAQDFLTEEDGKLIWQTFANEAFELVKGWCKTRLEDAAVQYGQSLPPDRIKAILADGERLWMEAVAAAQRESLPVYMHINVKGRQSAPSEYFRLVWNHTMGEMAQKDLYWLKLIINWEQPTI